MATGMDRLERSLDRLEKFFKRRKSISSRDNSIDSTRPPSLTGSVESDVQRFPSPSFIRPTTTRMLAREEIVPSARQNRRAQSLPESRAVSPRRVSRDPAAGTYCSLIDQFPQIPQRSSSLRQPSTHQRSVRPHSGTASLAELLAHAVSADFAMGHNTSYSNASSFGLRRSGSLGKFVQRPGNHGQHAPPLLPSPLLYTPPPSAREESFPLPTSSNDRISTRNSPAHGNPTPGPSPKLVPDHVGLDFSSSNKSAGIWLASRPTSLPSHPSESAKTAMVFLRRTASVAKISAMSSKGTLNRDNKSLTEPSFDDFLALSDDDIADDDAVPFPKPVHLQQPSSPPTCSLPPDPPRTALPIRQLPQTPVLHAKPLPVPSMSPPPTPAVAGNPAAVAAFEAARIAMRYNFDLVYVVNLWPNYTAGAAPRTLLKKTSTPALAPMTACASSPTISATKLRSLQALHKCLEGQGSVANISPPGSMNGRILAAYGLPAVLSPFHISAPVHQKVLQANGWLEYHSSAPAFDDFTRGYSCAFYTGYSPDGRWRPAVMDVDQERTGSPQDRAKRRAETPPNRGIIFAAYRLPNPDGTIKATSSDELDKLYQDAELLVETLIDSYVLERQKDLRAEALASQLIRNARPAPCAEKASDAPDMRAPVATPVSAA